LIKSSPVAMICKLIHLILRKLLNIVSENGLECMDVINKDSDFNKFMID
jgi:hypothetical protein